MNDPKHEFTIRRTDDAKDLPLPRYMSENAAGMDLHANIPTDMILKPRDIRSIPTGIQIALPPGYEAQIRPRSGFALKGVTLVNAPGTIDADYRGEIHAIMINLGNEDFILQRGDRIAQMVISPVMQAHFTEAEALPATERGSGGFGHTGKS